MKEINKKFMSLIKSKKFLVVQHRGGSAASIIENTSECVKVGKLQGADIIEADVIRSTDGHYYMFHDGNEKRLLGIDENIKTLSSNQIDDLNYINEIGARISKRVESLEKFLSNIPENTFINIDRSWEYWSDLLKLIDKYEYLHEYLLFKSPVKREVLEVLDKHPIKYMYFPIVKSIEEVEIVEEYKNINLVGFEIIETSDSYKLINSKKLEAYKDKNYMIFANTMKLNDETILFGSINDEVALFKSPNEAWGKLIPLGVNAIQTDWVDILYKYRETVC